MGHPHWLKSMENGTIGEVRTKELLIDRFWILERSVDIHGADFIIQRRLTEQNFLESEPVRLGYVQSKFRENFTGEEFGAVKIKREYAFDWNGYPRNEFFLILHTGKENSKQAFFLRSADLLDEELFLEEDGEFRLIADSIKLTNYLIEDVVTILSEIENALETAELRKNREFVMSYLTGESRDFQNGLLDKYDLDIYEPSNGGSLRGMVDSYKSDISSIINTYFVDGILTAMTELIGINDPREFAEEVQASREFYLGDRYSFGDTFEEGAEKFTSLLESIIHDDLMQEIENYEDRYEDMQKKDILKIFIDIKNKLPSKIARVINSCKRDFDVPSKDVCFESVTEIKILKNRRIMITSKEVQKKPKSLLIPSGYSGLWFINESTNVKKKIKVIYRWHLGYFSDESVDKIQEELTKSFYQNIIWSKLADCLVEIYQ